MATRMGTPTDKATLRARAEERLRGKPNGSEAACHDTAEETLRLVQELQVHQIELELQNDELQTARAELELGLERYSDLYDFAPVGYVTLDGDGAIRKMNLAGARLLGRERARLVGTNFSLFVSPESRADFTAFVQKVFATQTKEVFEVALCPVKSAPLWVHIEAMATGNSGRECRAVLVDVTERRHLEDTLRFRAELLDYAAEHSFEELLQKTLDMLGVLTGSPIGFYHFVEPDQNTLTLQAWSTRTVKEFCTAKGQGSHTPIEKAGVWADCLHRREPIIHNDYASLAHRKGLPQGHAAITRELVAPVFRTNLIVAVVGVGNKASDYTDSDVQIVSHLADVAWTIIERKRTEQELQHSEQRFKSLFESMAEGFALCEMIDDRAGQPVDFRYIEVNLAFARQTGLPVEKIVGRTVREVIPGIEKQWIEAYSRVTRTGVSERIESRVESLGKDFEVHAWRAEGNRFAVAVSDVTKLRQTEERLRVTQRMESIGRLAGGIAHDFNNMLAIIINYADLAMEDLNEPDSLQSSLTEIRTAGNRAAGLTRQLLAFSRKQVLQPQVLDLNKIVGGMEGMLRRLLGEDMSLAVVLAMNLGKVMADPGQVEQVLMNLAVNARDAMPSGGKLTIETSNAECDEACAGQHPEVISGPHVRLSVTDTGCGMDDNTRARVFEPFFTTKEVGKGTGLGLATAYGIVQQSGGAIQVSSDLGQGSTFTVLLPRELSGTETVARAITLTTRAVRAETVLVVEDEKALRTLVERVLCRAGYIVLTAANGVEALRIFEQHRGSLHLLLTDVVMPEMNGKELADQLVLQSPNLKVLYMSGYTDEAIVHRGVTVPGTHFISKPFNPAQLTRMVRKVLDGEAPSDQPGDEPGRSRVGDKST
jgi:two-component system cell cycle sensor histidine kinase/response regulator CckA